MRESQTPLSPCPDGPAPAMLFTFDLNGEGTRLLVVEGEDGFGRPYVAQLGLVPGGNWTARDVITPI